MICVIFICCMLFKLLLTKLTHRNAASDNDIDNEPDGIENATHKTVTQLKKIKHR
jgi:hypothetical protein